jgi:hypothetical protein
MIDWIELQELHQPQFAVSHSFVSIALKWMNDQWKVPLQHRQQLNEGA